MKKLVVSIIIIVMCLSVFACSDNKAEEPEESNNVFESEQTEEEETEESAVEDLVILESGYSADDEEYAHFGFKVKNPNKDYAFPYASVNVTAYDKAGDILATTDYSLDAVQPGEISAGASTLDCNGETPDKLEFSVDSGDSDNPSDKAILSKDFEFTGVKERTDGYGETAITGMVTNTSPFDAEYLTIVVLFKKSDKIVFGETTIEDNFKSKKKKSFEITAYDVPEHDTYEVIGVASY